MTLWRKGLKCENRSTQWEKETWTGGMGDWEWVGHFTQNPLGRKWPATLCFLGFKSPRSTLTLLHHSPFQSVKKLFKKFGSRVKIIPNWPLSSYHINLFLHYYFHVILPGSPSHQIPIPISTKGGNISLILEPYKFCSLPQSKSQRPLVANWSCRIWLSLLFLFSSHMDSKQVSLLLWLPLH